MLRFSISVTHAKRNSGRQTQFVNKTFDFRSNFEYHLEIRNCCCELLYLEISLCCPDNDGNKVYGGIYLSWNQTGKPWLSSDKMKTIKKGFYTTHSKVYAKN